MAQFKRRKKREAQEFECFFSWVFSHVEGGSLVVRVPNLGGSFEIDFRSHLLLRILRKKTYEPELITLAAQYLDPHRDVVDVGANIGLLTVFFARALHPGKKVLAIEPTPLAHRYLIRNLERNQVLDSVILYEGLAAEKTGPYTLNIIPGKEEYSSQGKIVHTSVAGEKFETMRILGERIDTLVERYGLHPGFIKIDTEGAELFVLRGALRTLRQECPVLLVEVSDRLLSSQNCSSQEVFDLLRNSGYRLINADDPSAPICSPYEGSILALPDTDGKQGE
jgi:FkbM family methyltransferase